MSENLPDPIDRLQSLRNGGIAVSPLRAEEVRRLGTRRRTRRHVGIAVASAAVVIAAIVPVALIATRDSNNGAHQIGPADNPTATVTSSAPRVITYPEPGIDVVDQSDASKLDGTTSEFQAFVGQLAEQLAVEGASCPDADHGVRVRKYSSAGYATGGINACGGYVALWAKRDSGWQEVMGGQEAFDCDALRYYDIPTSFVGDCYDYKGDFGPTEVNGLRLGMTEDQIISAGSTVPPADGPGCRDVLPADPQRIDGSVDGYLSSTKGLLAIFAHPGMKTPEGIGPGSTMTEARAAYPSLHKVDDGTWRIPLDGGTEYWLLFGDETVDTLALTRPDQDCFMSH